MFIRILLLVHLARASIDCSGCNYRSNADGVSGKWYTALSSGEACREMDASSVLKTETSISRGSGNWFGVVPSVTSATQSSICGFENTEGHKFSCSVNDHGGQCGVTPKEGECVLRMTAPTENAVVSTYNWTNIVRDVTQLDVFPSPDCDNGICSTVYLTSLVKVEFQELTKNALRAASDICYTDFDLLDYSIDSCVNTEGRKVTPGHVIVDYVPSKAELEAYTAGGSPRGRRMQIPGPTRLLADKFLRFRMDTLYERWTSLSVELGATGADGKPIEYIVLTEITTNDLEINENIHIEIVGDDLVATSTNTTACCESGTEFYIGVNTQPSKVNVTNVTFGAIELVTVQQTLVNATTGESYTVNATVERDVMVEFSGASLMPLQYVALIDYKFYPPPPPGLAPSPPTDSPPSSPPSSDGSDQPSILLIILIVVFSLILCGYAAVYFVLPRLKRNENQNWVSVVFE